MDINIDRYIQSQEKLLTKWWWKEMQLAALVLMWAKVLLAWNKLPCWPVVIDKSRLLMYFLITSNDQFEECHFSGVFCNKLVVNTERNQVYKIPKPIKYGSHHDCQGQFTLCLTGTAGWFWEKSQPGPKCFRMTGKQKREKLMIRITMHVCRCSSVGTYSC